MKNKFLKKDISVVVVGCVESTKVTIETLLLIDYVKIHAIITTKNYLRNSDYVDLYSLFVTNNIPILFETEIATADHHLARLCEDGEIDICFIVGWSRLISLEVFNNTQTTPIGYHPALLPKNRGRHPIIWSIVLGLKETGSTFFELTKDADAGAIINQKLINIGDRDTSRDLYNKLVSIIPQQINEIISDYFDDKITKIPQDHKVASYWRKRFASDGLIDWRMSSASIDNLVRALASPYPGADFMFNDQIGKVHSCETKDYSTAFSPEPGRVLDADQNTFLIKTGDGVLLVKDYSHNCNIIKGDYL